MRFTVFFIAFLFLALPAFAQTNDMRAVMSRLDQVQRQMDTIARQVYGGQPPPEAVSKPVLAGTDVGNLAAATDERLNGIESAVREINNRLDQQDYALGQLQKAFDLYKGDVEMRFQEVAPRAAPAPVQAYTGTPATEAAPKSETSVNATGQETGEINNPLPTESAASLYDAAFQALRDQKYDRAEKGFMEFMRLYPKDDLAGNAQYWLGETFYVRGKYDEAAKIFAQAYQNYPKSGKAPDNLLKLGLALAQSNKKQEACVTFQQLGTQYKNAAAVIKQRAEEESKKLNCGLPNG
jgi:tol-pal system protein YbgF